MSRLYLLLCIALVAGATRVPILWDEFGDPYVYGRAVFLYGPQTFPFRLTTFFTSSSRRPIIHVSSLVAEQVVSLMATPNATIPIVSYHAREFYIGSERSWNDPAQRNCHGIGPRSDLVRAFGSVDFVNVIGPIHSGFLDFGNSFEYFNRSFCDPNTIFNVTVDGHDMAQGYISGWDVVRPITIVRGSLPLQGAGNAGSIIELPIAMYESIVSQIRFHSRRVVQETSDLLNMVFESCRDVRAAIGPLQINFVESLNSTTNISGSLVFEPTDFTKIVGDDTCELLIGNGFYDESIAIDVLMLKDVNLQFTRNQVTFCDTSL